MVSFPPCKINLGLSIIRKRPDGYHDIETLFYPVPFTDILEIIPHNEFAFTSSGLPIAGDVTENLCVKAYRLLRNDFEIGPVQIHLHKIIPTGAGLGGGSSDAAHTLRLLNRIFVLQLTDDQLRQYAGALGSDCPFFITDVPMLGSGRGEVLRSVDVQITGKYLVLVNPGIHVATAAAYSNVVPEEPLHRIDKIVSRPVATWSDELSNDFEESVFQRYPQIGLIKDALYSEGALYAAMSGSGSTVFGIFDKEPDTPPMVPDEWLLWKGFIA